MSKYHVGEHVQLKGIGLTGYSGTLVKKTLLGWRVKFDPGQSRAGNTMFSVTKRNLVKENV